MTVLTVLSACFRAPAAPPLPTPCAAREPSSGATIEERAFMALLGAGEAELVDCSLEDLDLRGVSLGPWRIPAARLSILQSGSIDSSETFLRCEGVAPGADLEALVAAATTDPGWSDPIRSPGLPTLPSGWGGDRGLEPPAWWDPPSDRGTLVYAISPEEWTECRYPRGGGVGALQVDDRLYLQSFNHQHFYPTGGCGG